MTGQTISTHAHREQVILDRFIQKIRVNPDSTYEGTPCWEWTGFLNHEGYSKWNEMGQYHGHRVSHVLFIGPIPEGYQVDHLCRNRKCVSPFHLEAVTRRENMARMKQHKTHCVRGHEFTPANTLVTKRKGGGEMRRCRACNIENQKKFQAMKPGYDQKYIGRHKAYRERLKAARAKEAESKG